MTIRARAGHFGADVLVHKLMRGGAAALAIKLGAAGLSFAMFLALARAMTPADFGQFGFGFSAATLLAVIGSVGRRSMVLRFAAIYHDRGDQSAFAAVTRNSYLVVFVGSAICGAAFALAGLFWPGAAPLVYGAAGVLCVAFGMGELQPHVLRAAGKVGSALIPRDIIWRALIIVFAFGAAMGVLPQIGAAGWLLICALGLLAITGLQALIQPDLHSVLTKGDRTDQLQWSAAARGLWGSSVVTVAGANMAVIVVGLLLGPTQTGAFFAALRTAMVLNLFLMALNMVAAPMLSQLAARGDTAGQQKVCTAVAFGVGLPSLAAFAGFVFAGEHVLALFGPGVAAAKPVLLILAAGYLFSALAGPTAQILEMRGDQAFQFRAIAITTIAAMIALPVLIWAWGAIGAALALCGNVIAWNAWAYIRIHRHFGLTAGVFPLGRSKRNG